MMLAATRLTYRINRFEVVAVTFAAILSVIVTAVVVTWMRQSGYAGCLVSASGPSVACLNLLEEGMWFERIARASLGLVPVFPFLAGVLLGAPLVARELDRGTARLAWSLSPSRLRWFAQRLVPVLIVIGVSSIAIGIVAEWLVGLYAPGVDLSRSFVGFHSRGMLITTNALLIASVAVFIGSVVGRPLPAVLLSAILGGALLVAVTEVHKQVMAGETVVAPGDTYNENDLYLDGRFQLPDGTLVTWDELLVVDPSVMNDGGSYPYVSLVIPGNRYQAIEIREASVHVGLIGLFLAGSAFVVARRRPG